MKTKMKPYELVRMASLTKGEEKISKLLIDANIRFLYNYGFPEIEKETGYKLRFKIIYFVRYKG